MNLPFLKKLKTRWQLSILEANTILLEHQFRMPLKKQFDKITSPDRIKIAKQSIQAWGNLIPDVTSRVRTQQSILVRPPKGYIPEIKDDPESDDSDVIEVPKNLKESMLSYLQGRYWIMYPTLFSDFWGTLVTQDDIIKSSDGGIQFLDL